jgi:SAM-dependent methyltransferase
VSWIFALLVAVFAIDAVRMRRRVRALNVLPSASERAGSEEPPFVVAAGVHLDDVTRRLVARYAQERGLHVVDLVPGNLPTAQILGLIYLTDPASYCRDGRADGRTAGHALYVAPELLSRLGIAAGPVDDPVAFVRLAKRLKRHASEATDLVVVPQLQAVRAEPRYGLAVLRQLLGSATGMVLGVQLLIYVVLGLALGAGIAGASAWPWGVSALAAYQLQPLLVLLGAPVKSPDLAAMTLLRLPRDVVDWGRLVARSWHHDQADGQLGALRTDYLRLLQGGTERFFEPRRDTCPVCTSSDLQVHLRTTDLLQGKPGQFVLDRCRACEHIFQNPCLNSEGLDFYYKDFYDGLGQDDAELIFGATDVSYLGRARMVEGVAQPQRWLDVGGGHGHFCRAARDVWPSTRFDSLDLSESLVEAQRCGWVDTAFRGLFPELAPSLTGRYDVVSMHHYLEHTLDPRAELAAARQALSPGGLLLIEVPDPQSLLGAVLGRYWVPWFQPQHQHLLSRANLARLLDEHGFVPLAWERGEAHQQVDFLFAVILFLQRLAPRGHTPWRPALQVRQRVWRAVVWTLGLPFIVVAHGLDWMLSPFVRRWGMSNTYRVLARAPGRAEQRQPAGERSQVA